MKQLTFTVVDQTLTRTDMARVVGDTVGQFEATFDFNDWWDGYTATAQFTKNGLTYDALIVDGVCAVPDEAVSGSGNMYVNVFSADGSGNRKTVNEVAICVYASGLKTASATHAGPVITIWNVVLALLNKFSGGTAGQFLRKKSADSYDGEWVSLLIDADTEYRTAAEVDAAVVGITAELTDKEDAANKVTSISAESTDTQYPSAKAVYAKIAALTAADIAWDDDWTLYDMLIATFAGFDDAFAAKQTKTLYFSDVAVSDWDADDTYADYPYRASVALTDVEATMLPEVIYGVAEATSGNYAPICTAYAGGVYLYAKVDDEITIPSIKCEVTQS